MWDLVPWPEIELVPPALVVRRLSRYTHQGTPGNRYSLLKFKQDLKEMRVICGRLLAVVQCTRAH